MVVGPKALFGAPTIETRRGPRRNIVGILGAETVGFEAQSLSLIWELPMNPMSILTLPTSTLREACLHSGVPGPRGERSERRLALIAWVVAIMGALVFSLT
jgi:hypothetical protein